MYLSPKKKTCVYICLSVCLLEKESNIVILRKLDRGLEKIHYTFMYCIYILKCDFFLVSEVCKSHSYVTFQIEEVHYKS